MQIERIRFERISQDHRSSALLSSSSISFHQRSTLKDSRNGLIVSLSILKMLFENFRLSKMKKGEGKLKLINDQFIL